jgi:hypothetical protein
VLAKTFLVAALVVPNALYALRLARMSPRGRRDAPMLWLTHHAILAAHRAGEWESLATMWQARSRAR